MPGHSASGSGSLCQANDAGRGAPAVEDLVSGPARVRLEQGGLPALNLTRGLATAVAATLEILLISLPGLLDKIFATIICTHVAATVGVFVFYRPAAGILPTVETVSTPAPYLAEATPDLTT